ncbi:DUF1553 domain-containing protein [Phragmitibacter flavus]|nr:DUF1553 domain-containing protein [Phragmitibacter flavus]
MGRISALIFLLTALTAEGGEVQFNRDVRPILSDKCFACHGPDSATREAGLRLDTREGAIEGLAVKPGDVGHSELMARVVSEDGDEVMPPPESKLGRLSEKEIDVLKRWIEQGAEYQLHWAFEPVRMEDAQKDMDEVVLKKLREKGLSFQPEADKSTLIRRVSFDLTGLPPTVAEVEDFLSDNRVDAYERLVDRLLASPAYGERMAVDWLDMARYADSYGFQVDKMRVVWPWRDWVIDAFNENLPYDDFITWQVAGDLLPGATDEQILATAFNRLHQQESEGGSVEEEYRREYVADRLHTYGTAFLGLTFECARCHDHKYDPISHKEYYEMAAFFQNIDEAGLYSYFTESVPTPTLVMKSEDGSGRLKDAKLVVAKLEGEGNGLKASRREAFLKWKGEWNGGVEMKGELARFKFDEVVDGKMPNAIEGGEPALLKGENRLAEGWEGSGVLLTGDDGVSLPVGNFRRDQPFAVSLWMKASEAAERAVVFHRSRAWTDAASRGYELLIEEGKLKWSLIHFWPGNAISVRTKDKVKVGEWTQVTVSYDGSSRAAGLRMFVDGVEAPVEVVRDALTKEITGGGGDTITIGERFRDRGFKGGMVDDFRVFERELGIYEAGVFFDGKRSEDEGALLEFYLAQVDEAWGSYLERLQKARRDLAGLTDGMREMMVMKELQEPKKAYLLLRGEYNQHGEEVFADVPEVLPPLPEGVKKDRLALANWTVDAKNPLTARVTVNRFWQSVFGRGLVKTSEDFGSQGERPLHGELLDVLAADFVSGGWDVKRLMRKMVMSRTYRQGSFNFEDRQMMVDDPDNEWLSRGPRFRLPAEMIRDNALAVAGLLDGAMGGAPVNPYEMSEAFKPVKDLKLAGLHRRSLYTSWRRTAPAPAMIAFDAPRRAVCSAKRERTDSPLQALVLLNGPQFVEAARVMGERVLKECGDDVEKMIEGIFMRCLSRMPDERERDIVRVLHAEQLEHFRKHREEAAELLRVGQVGRDEELDVVDVAAATVLAQALMNHDSSVVKR